MASLEDGGAPYVNGKVADIKSSGGEMMADLPIGNTQSLEGLVDVSEEHINRVKELVRRIKSVEDSNALYYLCFQLLHFGGLSAEIPRFVVFGQQSMGKTTLLDYIMGGPIGYRSTDTGTKQPIVIMLRPSNTNKVECSIDGVPKTIAELQEEMGKRMIAVGEKISSEELLVDIGVPGGVHAVFVDLPGIKDDSKTGADITRAVVRNYVSYNPNDLYILVKKASDDPANWPWSLREFILSPAPTGLGLTKRQTVVVGTRAKEFIINERSDIRSQGELLTRVRKRAVMDPSGEPLPLHLMELFSLPFELRDSVDFSKKKDVMQRQVREGNQEVMNMILGFDNNLGPNKEVLINFFDIARFKVALNAKFQSLLQGQLLELEKKLIRKKAATKELISSLETKVSGNTPENCRESIRMFVRELHRIISQLITGNYPIMLLPEDGRVFMNDHGGSVDENLTEGDLLARELFSTRDSYDEEFFNRTKILEAKEAALWAQEEKKKNEASELSNAVASKLKIGSSVRFQPGKDSSNCVFGTIEGVNQSKKETPVKQPEQKPGFIKSTIQNTVKMSQSSHTHTSKNTSPDNSFIVNFYGKDTSDELVVEKKVLQAASLFPLENVSSTLLQVEEFKEFTCWYRSFRSDRWLGLSKVTVKGLAVPPASSNTAEIAASGTIQPNKDKIFSSIGQSDTNNIQKLEVIVVPATSRGNTDVNNSNTQSYTVNLDQLFMDENIEKPVVKKEETQVNYGYGRLSKYRETKLLNQLSITYLSNWMKYHISALEPGQQFSEQIVLQMMRSVQNVMDKADWEPLVADLLQANIRDGFLNLSKLVCCAGTVAIKRIFSAAFIETQRKISEGSPQPGLLILTESTQFLEDVSVLLDEFCKMKALECNRAMQETIFEQTHAIRFQIIEDLFEGCRQYEENFLGSNNMKDVLIKLKDAMEMRRQRLGSVEQIFKLDAADPSYTTIFNEVRMQFWVAKMLLSGPLASKLYLYYIKNIIDSSSHLASRGETKPTTESELEQVLYTSLTCERNTQDLYIPRSDSNLMHYYGVDFDVDTTKQKLEAARRTQHYVLLALEGITRLRHQIERYSGVDFLMKLDIGPSVGSKNVSTVMDRMRLTPAHKTT